MKLFGAVDCPKWENFKAPFRQRENSDKNSFDCHSVSVEKRVWKTDLKSSLYGMISMEDRLSLENKKAEPGKFELSFGEVLN